MAQRTIFALMSSLLAHAVILFSISAASRGIGAPFKYPIHLPNSLVYITVSELKPATSLVSHVSENGVAARRVASLSPAAQIPISVDTTTALKNQLVSPELPIQIQETYGLQGKSNITYWPFDEVDQAALMLAEWPEGMSTSAWPFDQPVRLELWINPDGALAEISFPQKHLPDSVRITLVEVISRAGFKPAIKNSERVGNHRMLEVLLSQLSVPPLVTY